MVTLCNYICHASTFVTFSPRLHEVAADSSLNLVNMHMLHVVSSLRTVQLRTEHHGCSDFCFVLQQASVCLLAFSIMICLHNRLLENKVHT